MAMPALFFFVKRQVRLLKPDYLSGKNKQNSEVTQSLHLLGTFSNPWLARGLSISVVDDSEPLPGSLLSHSNE
jgi:hypothetical protein